MNRVCFVVAELNAEMMAKFVHGLWSTFDPKEPLDAIATLGMFFFAAKGFNVVAIELLDLLARTIPM